MLKRSHKSTVLGWVLVLLAGAVVVGPVVVGEAKERRTGEAAILAALEEKTSCEFVDKPLLDVLEYFRETHNTEIQTDERIFRELGGLDNPVTTSLRNVTLRSALNLILREFDLTWIIADDVLLVTGPEVAELHLTTKVYDVSNLQVDQDPDDEWPDDFWPLISALTNTIEQGSWSALGGRGRIAPLEYQNAKVLVVCQTPCTHERVAKLLEDLREIADQHENDEQAADVRPGLRTGEAAILAALEQKTSVDFVDEPLFDVVNYFRAIHKIEIQIDTVALDRINLWAGTPVSPNLRNVKLRSALNLILGDLDLTWTIRDEVLWITTPEEAEEYVYPRIYDVTNLAKIVDEAGSPVEPDFDRWINLIQTTVQPDMWECYPSICSLEYCGARVLVVPQTREVHEEIAQLLADLKATADKYGEDVFPMIRTSQE